MVTLPLTNQRIRAPLGINSWEIRRIHRLRGRPIWLEKGLVGIEHVGGNRLFPNVIINEGMFAVVRFVEGGTCGQNTGEIIRRQDYAAQTWHYVETEGGFDLIDMDNGYFIVKFDMEEPSAKIIVGALDDI